MGNAAGSDEIRAYWQPGCTSCLRMKEFLTKHNVPFVSRNIVADASAMDELAIFGLRQVPVVIRGGQYADGQVLADVARIAGIAYGNKGILPVAELRRRLGLILEANARFISQVPHNELATMLPGRPRSYADLSFHIANIADAFLEHEAGIPLVFDAYNRVPPHGWNHKHLTAYGADVRRRVSVWFDGDGSRRNWNAAADVYYGRQSMHEFLERTTWHTGQHSRQLMWVLSEKLGIAPDQPLPSDTWADLPMPENVWDPV